MLRISESITTPYIANLSVSILFIFLYKVYL
nr:MAG TPA: hypothetical protein [Caudoviricetes sp.]